MDSTKEINCESTDGFKGEFEKKTVTASSRSGKKYSEEINMKIRKVRVENSGRKEKVEDCKIILKKFDQVISVERIVNKKSHGFYDVSFKDEC